MGTFGRKWEIRRAVRPVVVGTVMHLAPTTVAMFTADMPTTLLMTRVPCAFSGALSGAWTGRYFSVSCAIWACIFTASTGYWPAAVSPDSMTASVPS